MRTWPTDCRISFSDEPDPCLRIVLAPGGNIPAPERLRAPGRPYNFEAFKERLVRGA